MDSSRRRQRATAQASGQVSGPTFKVGEVVRLTKDIPFTDFRARDIVTIQDLKSITLRSPPPLGSVLSPADPAAPNDSNTHYGISRKVPVPDVTYYRSRDNGLDGAPHHRELSVVAGGPPATQRLEINGSAFLKKDVVVYDGPEHRTAHSLTARTGTRVFIVDSTTRHEASAHVRGNNSTMHTGSYYIVQAKVLRYRWQDQVCPHRASSDHFEKISEAEAARENPRRLPPPAVVSVRDDDICVTPVNWMIR